MTESEIEIIEGCKIGDPAFQKRLYLEYGPMIKGICARYTSDSEEAEDLFHDVFVYLLTHLDIYEDVITLGGWLQKITINKTIDFWRKKNLHPTDILSNIDTEIQDKNARFYDGLTMDELLMFVNQLPDKYRIIFNMAVIDEIPQKEICKKLNESATNIRTIISRAKAMLRAKIDEYLEKDNKL